MIKRKHLFRLLVLTYVLFWSLSEFTSPTTAHFTHTTVIYGNVAVDEQVMINHETDHDDRTESIVQTTDETQPSEENESLEVQDEVSDEIPSEVEDLPIEDENLDEMGEIVMEDEDQLIEEAEIETE